MLAIFGQRTLSGVAGDLVDALSDLPNVLVIPIVLVSQAVLLGLTIGAPIVLIIRGRKRIAGVGAIAIVVAVIAMVLIRYLLPAAIPSASLAVQSAATVRGPGFPSSKTKRAEGRRILRAFVTYSCLLRTTTWWRSWWLPGR